MMTPSAGVQGRIQGPRSSGVRCDVERALELVEYSVDNGAWHPAAGIYTWSFDLEPMNLTGGDHTLQGPVI